MRTVQLRESYRVVVDDRESYHKTFKLALTQLIKKSCDINPKPWGGNSSGYARLAYSFNIHKVSYVLNKKRKRIIVDLCNLLAFICDDECVFHISGRYRKNKSLQTMIKRGINRRWEFGRRQVEKHKLSKVS